MLYTIFDLETTGFSGISDSVVQFSFITVNHNLLPVRARNYYFYKEGMRWSEEAAAVHGLTREFLKQYEDEYEKNLLMLYTVLQRGNLIGHNSDSFDVPFASQFLVQNGLPPLMPEICYDTMKLWHKTFGKRMKLAALPDALGINKEDIIRTSNILFKGTAGEQRAHNASYDVTATMFVLREAVRRGICNLQPTTAAAPKPVVALSI